MRPNVIVIHTPRLDRLARVTHADEPALVQALIAEAFMAKRVPYLLYPDVREAPRALVP